MSARPTFAAVARAGFTSEVIPIMPTGVKLTEGSKLTPEKIGKVPGQYHRHLDRWCGLADWTERNFTDADRAEWDSWPGPPAIGLRTKFFPAIDPDVRDECASLLDKIKQRLFAEVGPAPVRGRSNAARCLFLFKLAAGERPFKKITVKFTMPGVLDEHGVPDEQLIEFLADGQQFVGWGAHKSGVPYTWDRDPAEIGADALPAVTLEDWRHAYEIVREEILDAGGTIIDDGKAQSASDGPRKPIGDPSLLAPGFDGLEDFDPLAELKDQPVWFRNAAAALQSIDNSKQTREAWVTDLHAAKAMTNADETFYVLVVEPWSHAYPDNVPRTPADADPTRTLWDSINDPQLGWDYVRTKARANGWHDPDFDFPDDLPPDPGQEASDAAGSDKNADPAAAGAMPILHEITPDDLDPAKIPARRWTLGRRFSPGTITVGIGEPDAARRRSACSRRLRSPPVDR